MDESVAHLSAPQRCNAERSDAQRNFFTSQFIPPFLQHHRCDALPCFSASPVIMFYIVHIAFPPLLPFLFFLSPQWFTVQNNKKFTKRVTTQRCRHWQRGMAVANANANAAMRCTKLPMLPPNFREPIRHLSAATFWGFSRGGFPENACIGGAISERSFCEICRRKSPQNTEKHKTKLCAEVPEQPLPKDPFFQLLNLQDSLGPSRRPDPCSRRGLQKSLTRGLLLRDAP